MEKMLMTIKRSVDRHWLLNQARHKRYSPKQIERFLQMYDRDTPDDRQELRRLGLLPD